MPRGVDRYDEARLQRRLWTPENENSFTETYFDLADLYGVTHATGVSGIYDRSGRGRTCQQTTGSVQPALVTGPFGRGHAIQGGGTKYMFINCSGIGTPLSTAFVIAYVHRWDGGGSPAGQLFDVRNSGDGNALIDDKATAGYSARRRNDAGTLVSTASQSFDNGVWRLGTVAYDGSNIYSRKDGGATVSTASSGTTTGFGGLNRIGVLSNGISLGTGLANSSIAAFIVVNNYTLLTRVEGYLAWRWGLSAQLSGDHPFKNRPPLIGD